MPSFITKLWTGILSFREAFITSPVEDTIDWSAQGARGLRYEMLWAQYEGTQYRDVHQWSTAYRKQYALYKSIRPIYNPAYRIGEFWKSHLYGGLLDVDAGSLGAIPIETENEALRPAIAELWKWSRWNVQKDVMATRGTIMGDIAIQIVDDVNRERVYLDLLHPGRLESVDKDPFGNVKGYVICEKRDDPRGAANVVTYREEVTREGENVIYSTYLNNDLYAWPDNVDRTGNAVAQWAEPYGFVPLVIIQHNDVGLEWGWSELHPVRAKVQEADDIASQISDQVRKTVDPIWLMKKIPKPKAADRNMAGADATLDRPAPWREEQNMLWNVDEDASAEAVVADLDLENVLLHLSSIVEEIERDVIELSPDINTASGDASGRALRIARQPVVSKVKQRRMNYDAAMVAAQQMGVAIGGMRGYDEYSGFGLESYEAGALDHSIGDRPVFAEDPLDKIEIDNAFWAAASVAKMAGIPLKSYLREAGWDEERITELAIVIPDIVDSGDTGEEDE